MSDDDRARYRVAIVVFADARGLDYYDAASGASMAVSLALRGGPKEGFPVILPSPLKRARGFEELDMDTRVVDVLEIGMAGGNGYLWTEPTPRAWRNSGTDDTGIARRDWVVPE